MAESAQPLRAVGLVPLPSSNRNGRPNTNIMPIIQNTSLYANHGCMTIHDVVQEMQSTRFRRAGRQTAGPSGCPSGRPAFAPLSAS